MGQCWAHREWIYQIKDSFHTIEMPMTIRRQPGSSVIIKGKECTRQDAIYIRGMRNEFMANQRVRWYPNGIKTIPDDIVLTPIALAHWCCGDGYRGGNGYHLTFCTDGFSDIDRNLLIHRLYEIYGWRLILIPSRGRLSITKNQDRADFKSLVGPYVPSCFQYKLDLKINERRLKTNIENERQRKLAHRRELYHNRSKLPSISRSVEQVFPVL